MVRTGVNRFVVMKIRATPTLTRQRPAKRLKRAVQSEETSEIKKKSYTVHVRHVITSRFPLPPFSLRRRD